MVEREATALLITDGGLAGLIACHLESLGRGNAGGRSASLAWFDAGERSPEEADRRLMSTRRAVEACQLAGLINGHEQLGPWNGTGLGRTQRLLAAGVAGLERGVRRVVWAVQAGGPGTSDGGLSIEGLDAAAEACDRATAVAQLLSLDAGAEGLSIETPFADLTDVQLADLAIETDAPVAAAYLGERGSEAYARWTRAFAAAGVGLPEMLTSPAPMVRSRGREAGRAV
jgi:hypothetical protein